jgi:hypothetical protein
LDIFTISSSVMDIFCDKSGCTNSIASAISLLFEELISESDRESKRSDLAFFMSIRSGGVGLLVRICRFFVSGSIDYWTSDILSIYF